MISTRRSRRVSPLLPCLSIGRLVKRDERSKEPSSHMPPGRGFSVVRVARLAQSRSLPYPPTRHDLRRHLEHQFGPPAHRPGRALPRRAGARRAVPAGDQVPARTSSRTRRSQTLGYVHRAVHGQKGYHGVATVSRLPLREISRHDWQDNGEARHVGVELLGAGQGHGARERLHPRRRRRARPRRSTPSSARSSTSSSG